MTASPPPYPQGYPGSPGGPGYGGYPGYAPNPAYPPAQSPYGFAPPGPRPDPGPRRYSVWSALVLFWSPKLWRDVGQRWRGIGLAFMLLLLCVSWAPVFARMVFAFNSFMRTEAPAFASEFPTITIRNGVASADVPQPHYVNAPGTDQPFAVIDTTGEVTKPTKEVPVLLTEDSLSMRKNTGEIRTLDLTEFQYYQLDGPKVLGYFETARTWFLILGYPGFVTFSLIGRLILMLLYGALGLAFASGFGARLTYAGCMRLAAISMVPVILIDTVLWSFGVQGLGCAWELGGIALSLTVLAFAVRANAPEPQSPTGFPVAPFQQPAPYGAPYGNPHPAPGFYANPPPGGYGAPPPPPGNP